VGRQSSIGLDCSGLSQLALPPAHPMPRDTDMRSGLGSALERALGAGHARGDLVFWKALAIVRDEATFVHANATRHMAVGYEAIAETIARIRATGAESERARLPSPA